MSDDARKSEWSTVPPADAAEAKAGASSGARTSFCQDCGVAVNQSAAKTVGSAVFCEPCLAARVTASSSAYTAGSSTYTTVPPSGAPSQSDALNEPSPALAAILGFIPGVGAMYNGQFAKGILHLIIFAVLVSLADSVNDIFGLFVAGWFFYMAFEAYHTAVARRDGLPLPNAFGFNDIGERMGFGRSFTQAAAATAAPQAPNQPSAAGSYSAPTSAAGPAYTSAPAPSAAPVGTTRDWVGYVPPTAFGGAASPNYAADLAAQIQAQAMRDAGYHVPYAETYVGTTPGSYPPPPSSPIPGSAPNRFPVGAIWLITLGVIILLANLLPNWNLTERWWPPVLFAALALWSFTRRLRMGARTVCIIRWPITLMVIAVLLALHAAYFTITFGLTISVLLIVFGLLLLLERTAGGGTRYMPTSYVPGVPANPAASPDASGDTRARTSWSADATAASVNEGGPKAKQEPAPEDQSKGGL